VKLLMLTATTNNWSNCRALREKRLHYRKRHDKLIFLHNNAPLHTSTSPKLFGDTQLGSATPYYSRLLIRPSTFWLSPIFVDGLRARWAELRFLDVRKWLDEWFTSKDEEFFWRDIHKLRERWEKCIVSEGKYFE